jgi:preprotein translocase SecE subunit
VKVIYFMKAGFLRLLDYLSGVKKEFKYIRFIGKKEVYQISLLVVVVVIVFSLSFSILDLGVSHLLKFIIGF